MSKIPEGATHTMGHGGPHVRYRRLNPNGTWDGWYSGVDEWRELPDPRPEAYIPIIPSPWDGEGLPPVGTVCEYKGAGRYLEWSEVKIFAAWGDQVFVDYGSGWRAEKDAERFRPRRTAEQIAAEERELGIGDLMDVLRNGTQGNLDTDRYACELIYDAGYRKQVQP